MTRNTSMEFTFGLMEENTQDSGQMESKMVMVSTSKRKKKFAMDYGRRVEESSGFLMMMKLL